MATVKIDLLANVADATKSIEGFAAKSSKTLSSINLKTTISAIRDFGAIASSVANTVANAFAAPIHAAVAQEDAVNSLTIALRTNGQATQSVIDDLVQYAATIQKTTKFSDDAVISNLAYLESLTGLSGRGLKEAQTAALNLSAALGLDLNTATQLVAKSATGYASALGRYGIQVKKGATDSETFKNALAQINKQFAGAATGQVKTYSGAVAQAANAYDDLLKQIGNVIIKNPVIIGLINQIGVAFSQASDFVERNREELIQLVNAGISLLTGLGEAVFNNLDLFKNLAFVIVSAFAVFSSGALIGAVISTFAAIGTGLVAVVSGFNLASVAALGFKLAINGIKVAATFGLAFLIDILVNQLIGAIEKGRETFGGLGNFATAIFLQISNGVRSIFIPAILGSVQFILDKLAVVAGFLNKDLAASLKGASDRITDALRKNNDQIQINIKALEDMTKAAAKVKAQGTIKVKAAEVTTGKGAKEEEKKAGGGAAVAIAGGIAAGLRQGGKEGALSIAQSIGGQIQNPYVQAALAAAQFLAQGAEAVRAQLTSVLDSIDQLVVDIIDGALEAVVVALEKVDEVIINLINRLPEIMEKIVPRLAQVLAMTFSDPAVQIAIARTFINVAPIAARTFATEFVKAVPGIVQAFFDEIKKGATGGGAVLGGGGGGGGLGGLLGFNHGGSVPNIPEFQNDGGLAKVSAGEEILDQGLSQQLRQFLASGGGGGAPQTVTVNLMLGEEQLANAILNLNRQGFRLA